jgi:Protein of unknown function (DUF3501)
MQKLTASEILDLRAYERVRDQLRAAVMELKRHRRIPLGELMTIVFENTETMRFQVQEMARAEKMLRDEQIEAEIAVYNELIPDPGELCGTLLIELTTEALVREWLPKLVGIQRAVSLRAGPAGQRIVPGTPIDEDRLTRDDVTSAVHYLDFRVDVEEAPALARELRAGPAHIVVDHPSYQVAVELSKEQREELARDLES